MGRLAGGRLFADYADEAWHFSLFRLALIAVMAGCAAVGPVVLRLGLGGPWSGYLVGVSVVVAVVGVLTTIQLGRPSWRDRRGAAFRLGEILLLLLAARLAAWVFAEGLPRLGDVRAWFFEPARFFTGEFSFAALVSLFAWTLAVVVTSDFLSLAIRPDEVAARESHEWGYSQSQWRAGMPVGRTELLQAFATRWIGVGVFLVICAALTRVEVTVGEHGALHLAIGGLGIRAEVVAGLVGYFLAGLLLMSQGRLAVLRGRWYNQEVEIRETLIRRWHVSSLVFVILIALVALLLPLGSTSWLSEVVQWVIALMARLIMVIGFLIGLLLLLLSTLLSRLFGTSAPPPAQPPPRPPQIVPSQAEVASQLPPWLGSAVLWLMVVLVACFLLVNFLRTSGLLEGRLGQRMLQLRLAWRSRRARINRALTARMTAVRRRLRRTRSRIARPEAAEARSRGPLLPRDQVRRYYLRAIEDARDEGVVRPPHKTPLEFENDLRAAWPDSEGDVRDLTGAFLDARYSDHEIGNVQASTAENAWRRLVRGLREAKRRRESG